MKKVLFLVLVLWSSQSAFADDSLRVLLIGNSYTAVNNLPQVIREMSMANGHFIEIGVNAPGGSTLEAHLTNSATQNLIQQGHWDFVVLQEQSQLPAFPDGQVVATFYPAVAVLDSLIHVYSPCARTVLYMTWDVNTVTRIIALFSRRFVLMRAWTACYACAIPTRPIVFQQSSARWARYGII